jgi:hypothetical protein
MKPIAADWFQHERVQDTPYSGHAVYDGELIDDASGCVPEDVAPGMERLARPAPRLVHPGHHHSFDTARTQTLITDHLASRREPGRPAPA